MATAVVIGGGLAGSEAAWQLAKRGVMVELFEMRPKKSSPAHSGGNLAELVCSNSLGADKPTSPAGILKDEMRMADSLIIRCAESARVPAGGALAVDREIFSAMVTDEITNNPYIDLHRTEVETIPEDRPAIIAAGPLMSGGIAEAVKKIVGGEYLSFFDAAAPIVTVESIDMSRAYRAGRYGKGDDYINCPMDRNLYEEFHRELVSAERAPVHSVRETAGEKKPKYFEGCLPVEVMAERGADTLRFGPMRPVGLADPSTGREPYAVVQLRRDNADGTLYNIVGFQTSLRWGEQDRVFRMIPALENAEFARRGVMHESAFVSAPNALDGFLRPKAAGGVPVRDDLFLAGQITGVEGYAESAASGLVAAVNLYAVISGRAMPEWPSQTAIGSLLNYLSTASPECFQPMNVNLGIFPPLEMKKIPGARRKMSKPERSLLFAERSRKAFEKFLRTIGTEPAVLFSLKTTEAI
jgi:methylenetetrahydrofolate--tRNA-(uracil-5-)-methyltransferase